MRKTQRRLRVERYQQRREAKWNKMFMAQVNQRNTNPMLEITFRTDELTAREMHLAYGLGTSSDPLIQIEFILLRAAPHTLEPDELTRALWQQPASHVGMLANKALLAATEATKVAMERAFGVIATSATPQQEEQVKDVF